MTTKIEDYLKKFGLNSKEIVIYKCLLKINGLNPTQISKKTSIPKTSVYNYLDNLKKKNLILSRTISGRKVLIINSNIEVFENDLIYQKEQIDTQLQSLSGFKQLINAVKNTPESNANISVIEGWAAPKIFAQKIIEQKADIFWIGAFGELKNFLDQKDVYRLITTKRLNTKTTSYPITTTEAQHDNYIGKSLSGFREPKFLSALEGESGLVVVTGKIIGLGSQAGGEMKITQIKDPMLSSLMQLTLFELWKRL